MAVQMAPSERLSCDVQFEEVAFLTQKLQQVVAARSYLKRASAGAAGRGHEES